jgi:hypothetical protein
MSHLIYLNMIQRIQTLFLITIPILLGIMQFLPLWSKVDPLTLHSYTLYTWKLQAVDSTHNLATITVMPYFSLIILALFLGILAIYTVFRYDNRNLQIQLTTISNILATVLIGMIVYFCTKNQKLLLPAIAGYYHLGFYIPALVVVCNLLAKHFIMKDEKLIQSSNRVR